MLDVAITCCSLITFTKTHFEKIDPVECVFFLKNGQELCVKKCRG